MALTITEFRSSTADQSPPSGLTTPALALWHDTKGDWETAHRLVQSDRSREAAWVHAYLHRKEGDRSNASFWYSRAGRDECRKTLEEEWNSLFESLVATD